jgi:lysophospholipase L1-like esterase
LCLHATRQVVYLQIGGNDISTWDSSPVRVDPIIVSFRKPFLSFYIYLLLTNVFDFLFLFVFLCCLKGSINDIIIRSTVRVPSDIISFANYLHYGLHVRIVIIGELLHRDPARVGIHYNCKVVQTNVAIKQLISSDSNNNIIFWKPRGFWADLHVSFLSNDGVHLNHGGMLKYFKSVTKQSGVLFCMPGI